MKRTKERCLILSVIFLGGFSINAYCGSPWEAFLQRPDKDALAMLKSSIAVSAQRCSWGNPGNPDVAPTEKQDKQLFELIGKGNESAFRAGLLVSRCLDGGELEDFYRSAGNFFEAQPHKFLQIVKKNAIPDSQLSNLLTMLSLDTVDDFDRQIYIIENRISLLGGVVDDSLKEVKKLGLRSLEKEKENLNRIKIEMGKAK